MKIVIPYLANIEATLKPRPVSSTVADINAKVAELETTAKKNDQIALEAQKVADGALKESSYARRVASKFRELIA